MRGPAVLVGLTLAFAESAIAQESASGAWFVGVAAGAGILELQRAPNPNIGPDAGLSFPNLKLGRMVTGRTAIVLLLPGTVYSHPGDANSPRRRDRGFEGIVPSAQHWLGDRLWVLAGAGIGMDAPAFYDIDSEAERKFHFGAAVVGGTGVEAFRRGRFRADVEARVHLGTMGLGDGVRQKGSAVSILFGLTRFSR